MDDDCYQTGIFGVQIVMKWLCCQKNNTSQNDDKNRLESFIFNYFPFYFTPILFSVIIGQSVLWPNRDLVQYVVLIFLSCNLYWKTAWFLSGIVFYITACITNISHTWKIKCRCEVGRSMLRSALHLVFFVVSYEIMCKVYSCIILQNDVYG